jgi:hypothetical protein
MAELSMADTVSEPCCTPEQHASCCEPSAKTDCCGHEEGCGCDNAVSAIIRAEKQDR